MSGSIIVPLDGSELAERALPFAVGIAKRMESPIHLVSALPIAPMSEGDEAARDVGDARAELAQIAANLSSQGLRVDWQVIFDDPVWGILATAVRQGARFIVMSTHGRSGFGRVVYGSIADEVHRLSGVPVLLVTPQVSFNWPAPAHHFRIVVPTEGSELDSGALSSAAHLAELSNGELIVVRAVPLLTVAVAEAADSYLQQDLQERTQAAHVQLASTLRELTNQRIKATPYVAVGEPRTVILEAAEAHHAHLIVMASHGRAGVGRAVFGSIADDVLRHAHIPVLIINPGAAIVAPRLADPLAEPLDRPPVAVMMTDAEYQAVCVALDRYLAQPTNGEPSVAAARTLRDRLASADFPTERSAPGAA